MSYPGQVHGNRQAGIRYDYLRMLRWLTHYLKGPGGEPPAYELDYGLDLSQEDDNTGEDTAMDG